MVKSDDYNIADLCYIMTPTNVNEDGSIIVQDRVLGNNIFQYMHEILTGQQHLTEVYNQLLIQHGFAILDKANNLLDNEQKSNSPNEEKSNDGESVAENIPQAEPEQAPVMQDLIAPDIQQPNADNSDPIDLSGNAAADFSWAGFTCTIL